MDFSRADEHGFHGATGRLVELSVNAFRQIGRFAPRQAAVLAFKAGYALVVLTRAGGEAHVASTAQYEYAVALAVGYDAGVAEASVEGVG